MENHHSILERELEENQMKINRELQMINQKLLEAIEQSKRDAQKSKNCTILKGKNDLGYFGICDVIDARDLSLSQPFLAILATIAYTYWERFF